MDYIKLFIAVPLPKTRLWDICEENNLFKENFNEATNRWGTGQIISDEYSLNQLTILRAFEWERINFGSEDKRIRTAKIMDITLEELDSIRKNTISNALANLE